MKCINQIFLATTMVTLFTASAFGQQLADASAGRKRAAVCFSCHGEFGVAKNPAYPNLAGQQRDYLEKQLRDFRDGRRVDPAMSAMAKPLSDDDIRNIATYYWGTSGISR